MRTYLLDVIYYKFVGVVIVSLFMLFIKVFEIRIRIKIYNNFLLGTKIMVFMNEKFSFVMVNGGKSKILYFKFVYLVVS